MDKQQFIKCRKQNNQKNIYFSSVLATYKRWPKMHTNLNSLDYSHKRISHVNIQSPEIWSNGKEQNERKENG